MLRYRGNAVYSRHAREIQLRDVERKDAYLARGFQFARSRDHIESRTARPLWPRHGRWISDAPLTHSVGVFHGWLCPDVRHIAVLDWWISMQILCSRIADTHQRFSKSASHIGQPGVLGERVLPQRQSSRCRFKIFKRQGFFERACTFKITDSPLTLISPAISVMLI